MFTISTPSISLNYFAAQQRGEVRSWQIEVAECGNLSGGFYLDLAKLTLRDRAVLPQLHLLPFDHCGKATDITRLPLLVR